MGGLPRRGRGFSGSGPSAGNCSVQGSVGKGQPGHPVTPPLFVESAGRAEGAIATRGSSFLGACASFHAAARFSASARGPAFITLSSCDFRSTAKVLQTPLLSTATVTHL